MFLPSLFDSNNTNLREFQINEILETNKKPTKNGVKLTEAMAKEIVEAKNFTLRSYGRIEIDIGVTKKLIGNFCDSPYVNQENYMSIINDLHEIFYYLKNETQDSIGDDELISVMKNYFNNLCGGSTKLLSSKLDVYGKEFIKGEI